MLVEEKYVNVFKALIVRGEFKNYLTYTLDKNSEIEIYKAAIYQGYLDACRTFTQNRLLKDDERIVSLADQIKKYITDINEKFDFAGYCNILMGKDKTFMSFGQAQKIVNMSFKYLYCIADHDDKTMEDKFKACHMPLDGIMLEWVYRRCTDSEEKRIIKGKIGSWSQMKNDEPDSKYTYSFYAECIARFCKKEGKFPLQIDFENWQEMSKILAAEEFLKALGEKNITSKNSFAEYEEEIIHLVKGNQCY